MNTRDDLLKLTNYLEENSRASEIAGITFIDPRNYRSKLLLKQNHVIFGRRGAGKTSLVKTILKEKEKNNCPYFVLYTNLEDYKDISFPNILLHVQKEIFQQLKDDLKKYIRILKPKTILEYWKIIKDINKSLVEFKSKLDIPDDFDETIKESESDDLNSTLKGGNSSLGASLSTKSVSSRETQKTIKRDKLVTIRNSITDLKSTIRLINKFASNKPIFLILDDFYFLNKSIQPYFIDFFHRLSKDTLLFLKVATIKHRSKLYLQQDTTYIGTEIGHDIHEIDLDYSLDRFEELKNFMLSLIQTSAQASCSIIDINSLFSDNGFPQLCLASGGVPRDFITLFNRLFNSYNPSSPKISKQDVNESAIENIHNKFDSLRTDSAEERETLEQYLNFIKDFIINKKRTNVFLTPNSDLDKYTQIRQAINELVDLRMFHIVEPNTSAAPSDGKMYAAYMIDIGLYPNAKPRDFKQIEPGVADNKGRKDQIRSSPRINLIKLKEYIDTKNNIKSLEITPGK